MNYKEKINLFESIELEEIRYLFESPTNHYFETEATIEKKINNYHIDLFFRITGRNVNPRFGSSVIIDDVTVKDVKVWDDKDDLINLSDNDLVKLEKILTTKMKELL